MPLQDWEDAPDLPLMQPAQILELEEVLATLRSYAAEGENVRTIDFQAVAATLPRLRDVYRSCARGGAMAAALDAETQRTALEDLVADVVAFAAGKRGADSVSFADAWDKYHAILDDIQEVIDENRVELPPANVI